MLVNNFKSLIEFYPDTTLVNVLGNNVSKKDLLYSSGSVNTTALRNNYTPQGQALSYNYSTTTATNSYTKEKTSYLWADVVNSRNGSFQTICYNGLVIFVGTGDTPVTSNDYCLDNAVELAVTAASCTHTENNKTYISRTFQNNTGSSVTITEIGCYVFRCNANLNTTALNNLDIVMIGRRVLQSPVTIADGDMYTFHYVIDMDTVNFVEN